MWSMWGRKRLHADDRMNVEQFIKPEIRSMEIVPWGRASINSIRLLYGENRALDDELKEKLKQAIAEQIDHINMYHEGDIEKISKKICEKENIDKDKLVFDNGIDHLLELFFLAFISKDDEIVIPVPTYPFYEPMTKASDAKIKTIQLDQDFNISIDEIIKTVTLKTKFIIIANPNNPTGNLLLTNNEIDKLCSKVNCIVIIDECYYGICDKTCMELTKKHKNLVVMRGFSKSYALAGMRFGYAVCDKKIAAILNNLINNLWTWRTNSISVATALVMLDNPQIIEKLKENKKIFIEKLSEIKGVRVLHSETSFILLDLKETKTTPKELKKSLAEKDIHIKDMSVFDKIGKTLVLMGIPKRECIDKVVNEIKAVIKPKVIYSSKN